MDDPDSTDQERTSFAMISVYLSKSAAKVSAKG
jgi:hypothetical protein